MISNPRGGAFWTICVAYHFQLRDCCNFMISSVYVDGRIWTCDSATPASRNATIYCGAEIMSLEWDCKSDRLVCN